ncbi:MAG: sensor histidine kinase [Polyangiaceae bacterium]
MIATSFRRALTWLLCAALVLLASGCRSAEVDAPIAIVDAIEVAEDPSGKLSVDEISSRDSAVHFEHRTGPLNLGLRRSAFWLRFRIEPSLVGYTKVRQVITLGRWLTEVEAFLQSSASPSAEWERIEPVEIAERSISPIAYELPALQKGPVTVMFRVHAADAALISPQLTSLTSYVHERSSVSLRKGAYYGLMIGVIGYNLFLAFWLRDRAYILYVLFETAFCATMGAMDRTMAVIWPALLPLISRQLTMQLMNATTFLSILFSREFLDLSRRRRFALVSAVSVVGGVVLIFAGPFIDRKIFFALTNVLVICNAGIVFAMTAHAWRSGNRNALLFAVAWAPLTAVVVAGALMNLGLTMPTFDIIDGIRVGSGLEALLFAAALAHRMSTMRRAEMDARAALNDARARLAESLQRQVTSLNTLVGGVAHEIGNPLNFASGGAKDVLGRLAHAQGLAKEPFEAWSAERAESIVEVLGAAERSAGLAARGMERIDSIVRNLRAYHGTGLRSSVPTDIDACIRSTVKLLDAHLKDKLVAVVLDLAVMSHVHFGPGEMNQVIMNLVLNACQAMPGGGTIVITTDQSDEEIRIVIGDSGSGVPESRRKSIFDPFFTTRAPNEGTGLGLSVSREIVRRHGGKLELLPPRARMGAEFAITLPL